MPDGFCIAALLARANPADALVGGKLSDLGSGARVGSSSLRRQAQLLALRPDIVVESLRGNVITRLKKLEEGQYDAIVLACAGLQRLGRGSQISESFTPEQMLPAAAQGVIGIECKDDRTDLLQVLAHLDHAETNVTTTAERAVTLRLQADCHSPVAAYAQIVASSLRLQAMVASLEGDQIIREQLTGSLDEPETLGTSLADKLLDLGAGDLLAQSGNPQ